MFRFVLELVRPYRRGLAVVFAAMLVETAMSLAGPWPIKVIIDNVVGSHPLPDALHWIRDLPMAQDKMNLALLAALAAVAIAALSAIATYIDNYCTESVGQWVAHDLRVRVYDHLHRLSTILASRAGAGDGR
jgi:subfamily B ATP-binding cassette protein MsbA